MLLIIVITVICGYFILTNPYRFWKKLGVSQCNPWPLFGDSWKTLFRITSMADTVLQQYRSHPNVRYYGLYQFFKPKLVICDPQLINQIIVKDFQYFTDRVSVTDPKADPLFAKNLVSLKGQEWHKMRQTLVHSFSKESLKSMFEIVTTTAKNFVEYFQESEQNLDLSDAFRRFAVDVIAATSFGVNVNSLADPNNQFFLIGKELTNLKLAAVFKILIFHISTKMYNALNLRIFPKKVYKFFDQLIVSLKSENSAVHMMKRLLESQKDDDEIIAQAIIFFFAGFDSVAALLTFMSYELAINSTIQNKLRKEICETIINCNGNITCEAILNMKYMDMVVLEALRKWPPFPTLGRECTKPYTIKSSQEQDLVIPKGMAIQIPVYAIQNDSKFYKNPEQFIPERCENNQLLGFGQGPRKCLGSRFALMEIKIMLFYLLQQFQIETIEKTQTPLKISKKLTIIMQPEKGLWLKLKKLN